MSDAMNEAWVEILPDFSRFATEAERGIVHNLGMAGDRGSAAMGTSLVAGVGKFAVPIAAAIAALGIGNLIGDAVRIGIDQVAASVGVASDLNESVNALNVSFGDASQGVQDLGSRSATSLGISNREFNTLAVRFSGFADAIVGQGGDAAGFIEELTTRGADFTSVYNLQVAEALTLFQSGLAGETEPLRRFGVDLSAAAVEAFAYANGIAAAGTPLTEAQKQQARYQLLLQETSKTEGDFANTSGELAKQQRILAASFEDAQARLGTALLPGLTELINLANEELVPILGEVIDEVGPILADALSESVPAIKDLVAALAPLIPSLVTMAVEALPPTIELLKIIAPLIADWAYNQATLTGMVTGFFDILAGDTTIFELRDNIAEAEGSIADLITGLFDFAAGAGAAFGVFVFDVRKSIGEAVAFIGGLPQRAVAALGDLGRTLYNSGRAVIQGFIDGVRSMFAAVGNAVGGIMDFVAGFFPNSPAERGPFSGSGWTALLKSGSAIMDAFESSLRPVDVRLGVAGADSGLGLTDVYGAGGLAGSAASAAPQQSISLEVNTLEPAVVAELVLQQLEARLRGS